MALTLSTQTDLYRFFAIAFNAAPGVTYMNQLYAASESGMSVKDIVNAFTTKTEFTSTYPAFLTNAQFANNLIDNVVGASATEAAKTAAKTQVESALTAGLSRGDVVYNIFNNLAALTGDATWGDTATMLANKVAYAKYYTETMLAGAEATPSLAALKAVLANVTAASSAATADIAAVLNPAPAPVNQTFTLTTGVDVLTGGVGNDTFNGTTGTATLNALDDLNGGSGTDALNYIQTGAISVTSSAKVKNIENAAVISGATVAIDASAWTGLQQLTSNSVGGATLSAISGANVTATDADLAAGTVDVDGAQNVTIDAAKVTTGDINVGTATAVTGAVNIASGLIAGAGAGAVTVVGGTTVAIAQSLKAGATNTTGAVDVTNDGVLTTVSATATKGTGATITYNTVTVTGLGSATDADTITSLTASGYTTVTTAHTNKLSSLSLGTGSGNVTIDNGDAGAATTTLALTVNGLTGGTLDDDDIYTQINITSTGTASTLANITDTALTGITLAGDKKLTLTSIAGATALTSVDASAATGGMTISSQLLVGTAYTGGSGVDTITLGATTKAIATGGGNDVVTLSAGTTALGTGGTVDAGDGTGDVLSFADADDATTASGGTTFETKISGFEVVNLAGAAGAGVTVNVANLDDVAKVKAAVDLGQTLAVSNIASGGTVTYEAAQTAASTITVLNAASGTDDSFNVQITSAAARNVNGLTISNVETINFLTDDTATTTTGIEHTAALTAAAAKTINVTGDAGLTLTFTGTALTTFDASAVTDGDVTWTAGALAGAASIKGGATNDANVIVLSAALGNVTYVGGSGTDTITMNHATNHDATTNSFTLGNGTNTLTAGNNDGDNTVTGGTGVDTITLGNGDNTVTTSSGNDVITVGTGMNVIDAGTGDDTITIGASAGTNTVNVGTGTDAIVFTGVQTAAGYYTSLTGMGAGDTLDFSATANDGGGVSSGVLGAKITLGGAASFANYLDAAAAGTAGATDSTLAWFQFNGNTYLVLDNSNAATFQDGGDQVVELVGLVSLATSTQDGSYVVTLV